MKHRNRLIFILFIFILLLVPTVMAKEKEMKGHMFLLAVSENSEQGSLADLYLEIKPGNGNIYIDTFPLTKMDTQLSTRFAKEIACKFLDKDCRKYDFFYTIKAGSSIIGGPSAGAASAMLTVALLDDDIKSSDINEVVTITGTINTGGIIGSVGGVKAKIEAAAANGMKKVLVPIGSSFVLNETKFNNTVDNFIEMLNSSIENSSNQNSSSKTNSDATIIIDTLNITEKNVSDKVNLEEFGESLGIEVIEVLTLGDALHEFTGKVYETPKGEIQLEEFYTKTMNKIGKGICDRSYELLDKLNETIISGKGTMSEAELLNNSDFNNSITLLDTSKVAVELGQSYSAASYCFGANINFDYLILLNANLSDNQKAKKMQELGEAINNSNNVVDNMELVSFNDLQTYMIVKERIAEAFDVWEEADKALKNNQSGTEYNIAYVTERLFSAYSWSHFFNTTEDEFIMDDDVMSNSCKIIISEAQERVEYFRLLYPYPLPLLESTSKEIDKALNYFNNNRFKMCLMHATKAKSEIDAVLGSFNLEDDELIKLLNAKLGLAEQIILEQQLNGLFPIQGYSYYEYAKSLGQEDPISGLIYSQYALEFSNLNLYFERIENKNAFDVSVDLVSEFVYFDTVIAFVIGIIISGLIFLGFGKKSSKTLSKPVKIITKRSKTKKKL